MRVVFLNTQHGVLQDQIFNFLKEQSSQTDIFCFQEADGISKKVETILSNFTDISTTKGLFNLATYIKNNYWTKETTKSLFKDNDMGSCQKISLENDATWLNIFNVHGIPQPGDKLDTSARLKQSDEILKTCIKLESPKIIGGDFNLLPNTESITKFEKNGFRNLIKEFKVKTTRNLSHWDGSKDAPYGYFGKQDFADYVFVSPEIKVKDFQVPAVDISDHLPLILDFEI